MLGASRDLSATLAKLSEDWKAQPRPDVLMPFIPLVLKVAQKCPNLLVAPSVMLCAVSKLDEQNGPVNFSGLSRSRWANIMSGKLRCLLSKWRRVAMERNTYRKFLEKISATEKKQVHDLLTAMGIAI